MPTETIRLLVDIATPLALAFLAYVTVMNRMERGKSDLAIQRAQAELKEDFNEKHSENKQDLAVHVAEDNGQFLLVKETLARMDRKLDKIANGK